MDKFVDIGLYASYALVIICAVLAILMPLINSFGNPKSLLKPVVGLLLLVVIVLVGWAMADNTAMGKATESISKWVGGFLISMYILIFVAIAGILYTEVSKIFK